VVVPERKQRGSKAKKAGATKEAKNKADAEKKAAQEKNTANAADADAAVAAATPAGVADATGAAPAAPKRAALGDLAELQKRLEEERSRLQLFVIKAKAELEEKLETKEKRDRREREYYKATSGEPCGPSNRFLVEGDIGRGAFSTVYRCRDMAARGNSAEEVAIKFVRMNAMLRKATEKEIKMYRRLRNSVEDPEGARCLMNLGSCETFEHHGHLAVVFPLQRCDLRAGLRKYGQGKGLPLDTVEIYARNILLALRALRKVSVIHSDLKPENLLMSLDKASVKLADFGSAMDLDDRIHTDEAQPRYYRAPEVILGHQYAMQIDIWSAGATIFELATGRFLFTGDSNNGMIHAMLKLRGAFAKSFATMGEFSSKHFDDKGSFRLTKEERPKKSNGDRREDKKKAVILPMSKFPRSPKPFLELLESTIKEPTEPARRKHQTTLQLLADLVARCTEPDPEQRVTPEPALVHRFFRRK